MSSQRAVLRERFVTDVTPERPAAVRCARVDCDVWWRSLGHWRRGSARAGARSGARVVNNFKMHILFA